MFGVFIHHPNKKGNLG